jgi:hypothetical protein
MKTLKKILLSLLIASSMGAVSSSAFAEAGDGRIVYTPTEALDLIEGKIKVALEAITKGAEGDQAQKLIKEAVDATKELNANDKVDIQRQRATGKLKAARTHAKGEALQEAEQELRDSLKMFEGMRGML